MPKSEGERNVIFGFAAVHRDDVYEFNPEGHGPWCMHGQDCYTRDNCQHFDYCGVEGNKMCPPGEYIMGKQKYGKRKSLLSRALPLCRQRQTNLLEISVLLKRSTCLYTPFSLLSPQAEFTTGTAAWRLRATCWKRRQRRCMHVRSVRTPGRAAWEAPCGERKQTSTTTAT